MFLFRLRDTSILIKQSLITLTNKEMGKQKLNWKKYTANPYTEGRPFTLHSVESIRGRSSDEESRS